MSFLATTPWKGGGTDMTNSLFSVHSSPFDMERNFMYIPLVEIHVYIVIVPQMQLIAISHCSITRIWWFSPAPLPLFPFRLPHHSAGHYIANTNSFNI